MFFNLAQYISMTHTFWERDMTKCGTEQIYGTARHWSVLIKGKGKGAYT